MNEITTNGINIIVPEGASIKLTNVGKCCDKDIIITTEESGSNDAATGIDVSTSFGVNCGDKWYCPTDGEGSSSFRMMSLDTTGQFTVFSNMSATPGKKYRAIFKPMNSDNLWESFVFGKSDYMSLAVIANDESIGQYVTKVDEDTFEFTVPTECACVFLNGYIQYGCRVYEIE